MNVRLVHSVEEQKSSDKERLLATLREMLQESFRLRNEGSAYARLTHSQGCVDGYMRALTQTGVVNDRELLQIIAEERRGVNGPATRRIELEVSSQSA
jgi:hypothetical protein